MSNMWAPGSEDPRTDGNPVGELATYREYLTNYRLTIELKCSGLDAEQLARRSVPPSTLSLLGLVRHLAQVENHWFQRVLQGRTDGPRRYQRDDDFDWDFNGAVGEEAVVSDAFETWKAEIAGADAVVGRARRGGPGPRGAAPRRHGLDPGRDRAHDRGVRAARRSRRPAP